MALSRAATCRIREREDSHPRGAHALWMPSPGNPPNFSDSAVACCQNLDCDSSCGQFAALEPLAPILRRWASSGSLTLDGSHVIVRLRATSVQDIAFLAANAGKAAAAAAAAAGVGIAWQEARVEGVSLD